MSAIAQEPAVATDGTPLHLQRWPAPDGIERRGTLLVVHGLGEHCGRYERVAQAVGELGLETWSYDHRGHGRSGGPRGSIPHPDALLDDLRTVFDRVSAEALAADDRTTPFLLGHSMGGGVAARAATGGWVAPRGLILSSPGLRLRLNAAQRAALALGVRVAADRAIPNGIPVDAISRDADEVAAYRADELVHDRITPRLTRFMLDAGPAAIRDAPAFAVPTLLLVAGADRLLDPAGARAFADALPAGGGTLRWYDDLYHEVFNAPEPDRARVLADLREWLAAQLGSDAARH